MDQVQGGATEFRLPLTVDPRELGRVRRMVLAHLRMWRLVEVVDPAQEIVTELLTNVHRHADGRAVLTLLPSRGLLEIVVSDRSRALPVVAEPDLEATSGRGMLMVVALSDAWWAEPTAVGKEVHVIVRACRRTEEEQASVEPRRPARCPA